MQVEKSSASGALDALKSDEGSDSIAAVIRHEGGAPDAIQWAQWLNSLYQPGLLGFPLFVPMKVPLQKCEKCSSEFFSPINYRRHIRMHRRRSRSLNVDKESHKNRDLIGAFWDNLSLEDAKNVVSFDDISLKGVSGASVLNALESALRKPGVWTMPHTYVASGSIMLEVVQDKYSRKPISSQELFEVLDGASERTFLCAGTAESVQRFIIDGEAEEALEMKNLIASASLLFEKKLVIAWLANKDTEALKCQKLLEEEEEAAEKRRSQLLNKKKQKQLRQQEQKAREHCNRERVDNNADSDDKCINFVDEPSVAEISVSQVSFENNQDTLEEITSFLEFAQLSNEDIVEARLDLNSDHIYDCSIQRVDSPIQMGNVHPQVMNDGWQVPKSRSHRSGRNGFDGSRNLQAFNLVSSPKQGLLKGRSEVYSGKVQTRKANMEINDESSGSILQEVETKKIVNDESSGSILQEVETKKIVNDESSGSILQEVETKKIVNDDSSGIILQTVKTKKIVNDDSSGIILQEVETKKIDKSDPKLLIGSISVPVSSSAEKNATQGAGNTCSMDSTSSKEDQAITKSILMCSAEISVLPAQNGKQDRGEILTSGKFEDNSGFSKQIHLQSSPTNTDNCDILSHQERNDQLRGVLFSSSNAKAFLTQRWNEVISGDHVKVVLS